MIEVRTDDLWELVKALSAAGGRNAAAIAYVSDSRWLDLGAGDLLVVNASRAAISSGGTSAAVLQSYFDNGVTLHSLATLHAKIAVLGTWAVVGSANAVEPR